jgi:hypothetical protein
VISPGRCVCYMCAQIPHGDIPGLSNDDSLRFLLSSVRNRLEIWKAMAEVKFPHPYTIGGYVSFQFSIRSVLRAPFCASFCVYSLYQLDSMCQQKRGDSQYHRRCRRFQHPSAPCQHSLSIRFCLPANGFRWKKMYVV